MDATKNLTGTYDWICVGSGAAGLAGALAGAALGGEVLVLEKTARLGGSTAYSYGALWAPANPLQAGGGVQDNADDGERYLRWLAGGFEDEARLLRLCRGAPEALTFFMERGIPFRLIPSPDHYYPEAPGSRAKGRNLEVVPMVRAELGLPEEWLEETPYMPPGVSWSDTIAWGGMGRQYAWDKQELAKRQALFAAGQGLSAWLVRRCHESGVTLARGARLHGLLTSAGAVNGVEVEDEHGRAHTFAARRGVLLATGGYEGNPRLVRAFEAFPNQPNHFTPALDGDGLMAGAEIGALVSVMPFKLQTMLGYLTPDGHGFRSAGIQELAAPHTVVVNSAGRRFADESFFQETQSRLRVFDVHNRHGYANLPCYLIFDAQFAASYSFAGRPPGAPIPDWVVRADSAADVAAKLGIDAAGLQATLAAFNDGARRGEDPLFRRGHLAWARMAGDAGQGANPNLGTVEQAPFYGIELLPSGTAAAGLTADECGRVLHVRGRPIPGLYGAGNVCACTEYGAGFQAGLTLMSGLVFGYWAARTAFGGDAP